MPAKQALTTSKDETSDIPVASSEAPKPESPWFCWYRAIKTDDPILGLQTRALCTACATPHQKTLMHNGQPRTTTGWTPLPWHLWNRDHVHCLACDAPIFARTKLVGPNKIKVALEPNDRMPETIPADA